MFKLSLVWYRLVNRLQYYLPSGHGTISHLFSLSHCTTFGKHLFFVSKSSLRSQLIQFRPDIKQLTSRQSSKQLFFVSKSSLRYKLTQFRPDIKQSTSRQSSKHLFFVSKSSLRYKLIQFRPDIKQSTRRQSSKQQSSLRYKLMRVEI